MLLSFQVAEKVGALLEGGGPGPVDGVMSLRMPSPSYLGVGGLGSGVS